MISMDDIERYMIEMDLVYENLGKGTWVIRHEDKLAENIIVRFEAPIVVFRIKLMELDGIKDLKGLYRKLLELNATDMTHGAYGIENNYLVITDSLEAENMDFNEFQGSIEGMTFAIHNHYPIVSAFKK